MLGFNQLHRYRGFDVGMVIVVFDYKVFVFVIEYRVRFSLDDELWVGVGLARELKFDLFKVVAVYVAITAGPNEVTYCKSALLCNHMCQQCVTCDIERHTKENICATLVQLT